MMKRLIFGVVLIQIIFPIMSMEKNVISCEGYCGEMVDLDQWKIEESIFLYERQLLQNSLLLKKTKPICADLVNKKELELFSQALDWKRNFTLLYHYVRLTSKDRHMLLDVISKSKLQAEELEKVLTTFYVTGLYMRELIELQKNPLIDVGAEVIDVGSKMIRLIGIGEKNEESLRLFDDVVDTKYIRIDGKYICKHKQW